MMLLKTKIFIILIILGLIIIGSWFLFFIPEPPQKQQQEIKQETVLVVDYGNGISDSFSIEFIQGMTAFDLLEQSGLVLEIKTYDVGIFIEAINNVKNGQDNKYWMYYVNDEMPMVSADNMEINSGDEVEFKFEESSF